MNAIRRFLRLLWIEIQRSPAALIAVLALAVALPLQHFNREGVELWHDVSQNVVDAHLVYAPLGAAIAVWAVGRSRRRGMGDQESALPATAGATDLMVSLAVAFWMLVGYLAFFVFCATPAIRFATWGGPNVPMILAGAMTILVGVGFGSVISRLGRTAVLAPATLIAIYAAMVYVADADWYSPRVRLVPTKFFGEIQEYIGTSFGSERTYWLSGWLLAISVACWGLFLLIRSRSVLRVVVICLAAMLATFSANQVMAEPVRVAEYFGESETLDCEMASGIEVCVHPAFESLLDDVVAKVNTIAPNFAGLSGLPSKLYQEEAIWVAGPDTLTESSFSLWDRGTIEFEIPRAFMQVAYSPATGNERAGRNASQCAVGMALTETAGDFPHCVFGIVYESVNQSCPPGNELGQGGPDQADFDVEARKISDKAKSFAALTPEARQAWLDENWDALRAGDLELEDLP